METKSRTYPNSQTSEIKSAMRDFLSAFEQFKRAVQASSSSERFKTAPFHPVIR